MTVWTPEQIARIKAVLAPAAHRPLSSEDLAYIHGELAALPSPSAARDKALEEAACICDERAKQDQRRYAAESDWRQPYASNRVLRASLDCAAVIRALKSSPPAPASASSPGASPEQDKGASDLGRSQLSAHGLVPGPDNSEAGAAPAVLERVYDLCHKLSGTCVQRLEKDRIPCNAENCDTLNFLASIGADLAAMREVVEAARQVDLCNTVTARAHARSYRDVPAADYRNHMARADLALHDALAALTPDKETGP